MDAVRVEAASGGGPDVPGDVPASRAGGAPPAVVGALAVLSAALASLFVASACVRSLNFDEAFAIRSGWLLWEGTPADPVLVSPATTALGALAASSPDPGTVFLLARLLASLTVLAALLWACLRVAGGPAAALAAVALALGNGAFLTHALEFRYDWALLVGVLLALGLAAEPGPRESFLLGVVSAWIASHHVKGAVLGAALAVALLALLARRDAGGRRLAGLFLLGLLSACGAWLGAVALWGRWDALERYYAHYVALAVSPERQPFWATLGGPLRADVVWWAVALLSTAAGLVGTRPARRLRGVLVVTAAASLPLLAHPRPFAYMLALVVPGFALATADYLVNRSTRVARRTLVAALAVLPFAAGTHFLERYRDAFRSPRAATVATLRTLRGHARPDDRVFDPSGVAYFLAPCFREWYVDVLFAPRLATGEWMTETRASGFEGCTWVLYTYRVRWLPETWNRVRPGYRNLGGGLYVRQDDPRAPSIAAPELARLFPPDSYW